MKAVLSMIFTFVFSLSAFGTGWAWWGYYPYIWDYDADAWLYLDPCGDGFNAYNYGTEEWETVGDIPEVEDIRGKTVTLDSDSDDNPVSSIVFSSQKTEEATLVENGTEVSCWWSGDWSTGDENSVFVLKTESGYYYTITLQYSDTGEGSFVLLVPSQDEDCDANDFMSIYSGDFTIE